MYAVIALGSKLAQRYACCCKLALVGDRDAGPWTPDQWLRAPGLQGLRPVRSHSAEHQCGEIQFEECGLGGVTRPAADLQRLQEKCTCLVPTAEQYGWLAE